MSLQHKLQETAQWIRARISVQPRLALILGSGLGVLADSLEQSVYLKYEDIPHFPVTTVEGHEGALVVGNLNGTPVAVLKGRFHLYEGYSEGTVAYPIRVMKALGIDKMVVTNAAGGINERFKPGDFMLIRDHINLMFRNPLIGPNEDSIGPRFPDLSEAYSKKLLQVARKVAAGQNLKLQEGVYVGMTGPTYETPAEVKMLRKLGGDAAGMSTVPEVIAARHAGMQVLGISCITNMAAGMLEQPLSHDEVVETAVRERDTFIRYMVQLIPQL
ncbi:purine-nucleoside phosphorylase [Paenibacillus senegalensis]|uniref:purine-nucleoside phosphorylase n=1 Tax=Paenibacillus senegalensis TaxID=1465766 RepID=UPI00028891EF|nr:purine-nucleoside phosphorylase [Paenibacillus senegalensis]